MWLGKARGEGEKTWIFFTVIGRDYCNPLFLQVKNIKSENMLRTSFRTSRLKTPPGATSG